MPVTIFHGNRDQVIRYEASLQLKEEFKDKVELIILNGQGHNGVNSNEEYTLALTKILQE